MDQQLPKEVKIEEKVVSGEAARNAWKEAFEQLGQVNEDDVNFEDQFIKDCKEQIDKWLERQMEAKGELDKPIERAEVRRAVKAMKSGKASGIDGIGGDSEARRRNARDDMAAMSRCIRSRASPAKE